MLTRALYREETRMAHGPIEPLEELDYDLVDPDGEEDTPQGGIDEAGE